MTSIVPPSSSGIISSESTKNQRQLDSPEESIAQNHIVQSVQLWLIDDIPINEEEYREIDFLASSDLLLFKAKTFHFGKIRRNLSPSEPTPPPQTVHMINPPSLASCYTLQSQSNPYPRHSSLDRTPMPFLQVEPSRSSAVAQTSKAEYHSP